MKAGSIFSRAASDGEKHWHPLMSCSGFHCPSFLLTVTAHSQGNKKVSTTAQQTGYFFYPGLDA